MIYLTLLIFLIFGGVDLMANNISISKSDPRKSRLCSFNPDTLIPNEFLKIIDPKNMWIRQNSRDDERNSVAIRFRKEPLKHNKKSYYELEVSPVEDTSQWYPARRYYREDDGMLYEFDWRLKKEIQKVNMHLIQKDTFGPIDICRNEITSHIFVSKVDSMWFNDQKLRKRIHLSCLPNESSCDINWIEGIGDPFHLFRDCQEDTEGIPVGEPSCFYHDNELVYAIGPCWKGFGVPGPVLPLISFDMIWYIGIFDAGGNIANNYALAFAPLEKDYSNFHELIIRRNEGDSFWERTGIFLEEKNNQIFYFASGIGKLLLYDFQLDIADKIELASNLPPVNEKFMVISADSIQFDDQIQRKRTRLQCEQGSGKIVEWIEGIGSLVNPFILRNHCTAFGDSSRVLCIEKSGQLIYKYNRNEASCWSVGTENKLISKFEIFPNPFYNNMHIAGELPSDGHILISDFLGKIITKISISPNQQQVIFDSGDLVTGIYAIQIFSKHRLLWSGKRVKP